MTLKEAYDKGIVNGLEMFAWWKDGEQFVGSCGTTFKFAKDHLKELYGYDPPKEEELTIDLSGLPHVKGTPHISRDLVFHDEEEKEEEPKE